MRQTPDVGGTTDTGQNGSGTRSTGLWGKGKRRYSLLLVVAGWSSASWASNLAAE